MLKDLGFNIGVSQGRDPSNANSDHQEIKDFTLVDFRYLVVLISNKSHVVVFDCHQVLSGSARQVRNINKIQLTGPSDQTEESLQRLAFNRIESIEPHAGGGRYDSLHPLST